MKFHVPSIYKMIIVGIDGERKIWAIFINCDKRILFITN